MELYNIIFVSIYKDTVLLAYIVRSLKQGINSFEIVISSSLWTICIQVPVKAATKAAPAKKVESESDDEDDDEDEDDSEDEKVDMQKYYGSRVRSCYQMRMFLPLCRFGSVFIGGFGV